jgi:hypothetical protein
MALANETVLLGAVHPGTELEICCTPGGYFLGFKDRDGSHYSRETHYMTYQDAVRMMELVRSARPPAGMVHIE